MTPIVDNPARFAVGPVNDPIMGADDLALGNDHQTFWIDVKADTPVRETGRDTVAVALKSDQTCLGYTLAVLDKSIKSWWQCHQQGLLSLPNICD